MKKYNALYTTALILIVLMSIASAESNEYSAPEGPYLGQKPPGKTPQIFAPGIISVDENFEHSAAVFSPDGNEVFWCSNVDWYTERKQPGMLRLYYMKLIDGKWTEPKLAPFAKDIRIERPTFSPDGNRLYFESFTDPSNMDDVDIFMVERNGDSWSDPEPLSSAINSPGIERIHCITNDGSFYFSRNPFTPREEIFVSKWENGEFSQPEKLGEDYNSSAYECVLVLSHDEDYMLIGLIDTQHRSPEFKVCFKQADGSWSDRIRIPFDCGGFLSLSPDGKYLFFLGEGIYWVSTDLIEDLRPN